MGKLYTCKEVAERYRVMTYTVWEWIRTGKLSAVKIGRVYRIKEEALVKFENGDA